MLKMANSRTLFTGRSREGCLRTHEPHLILLCINVGYTHAAYFLGSKSRSR